MTLESLTAATDKCRNTRPMFHLGAGSTRTVADVWEEQPSEVKYAGAQ